jgi:hypothetical protein
MSSGVLSLSKEAVRHSVSEEIELETSESEGSTSLCPTSCRTLCRADVFVGKLAGLLPARAPVSRSDFIIERNPTLVLLLNESGSETRACVPTLITLLMDRPRLQTAV